MKWIKKGLIFEPQAVFDWMVSHAMTPFAERIDGDIFRVYYSSRDEKGRAQMSYFDADICQPGKVLYVHDKPIVGLGPLGAFDDSGVTAPWMVNACNRKYLFYNGWSLWKTVPFAIFIGLAISEDGGKTFQKVSQSPILARDPVDPYLTAALCVLIENDTWKMWYTSGVRWVIEDDQPKHYYHIKYAESKDGINWERKGVVCIDFEDESEYAIAHPSVIHEKGLYKMWYCYRGENYRVGYAESEDGLTWERKDEEVGIDVSESGWDSEMLAYPSVFDHKGQRYMLYNGNGYGRTGIGLAVLEK